jgi:hypothetical protein
MSDDLFIQFDISEKSEFYSGYRSLREAHTFFKKKANVEEDYITRCTELACSIHTSDLLSSFVNDQSAGYSMDVHQSSLLQYHRKVADASSNAAKSLQTRNNLIF